MNSEGVGPVLILNWSQGGGGAGDSYYKQGRFRGFLY